MGPACFRTALSDVAAVSYSGENIAFRVQAIRESPAM